ncbi:FAD-binding oxidoreductase [uncultured Kriegella sp.]|uniref:NAD(P)/FAD-dependent oxidoreductase n=1 Tax=uncultured Kriegella sp. TaxID=1798910 RepID=UPI0030D82DA5|tara:strand:+ start:60896 stop:61939 length:1044 start_codon:yes stop_codon:yes gene_type:complete
MVDYIIVGLGLAGVSFCEQLEKHNKSFMVVSDDSQTSSLVAAGLYNPVILKRFTLAWNAKEQLDIAIPHYKELERKMGLQLDHKVPVFRRFASIAEQNSWFEASDKKGLQHFLSTEIRQNKNRSIDAPYGYGKVKHTGRIDTGKLLLAYRDYLRRKGQLVSETFDYDAFDIRENGIAYKTFEAKHIVFAEGFGLRQNPYFKYLPLNGTKGELLTIRSADLKEENVIKSSVFVIPLGNNRYRIGATYERNDKTNTPTLEAKSELVKKFEAFVSCDYEIESHSAGIRPTVTDRKPLVGRHAVHKNLYVLNGLGSRGVIIGPYAAKLLYEFIEYQSPINKEMNIERFVVN